MAAAGLGFLVVIQLVSPGLINTFLSLFQNAGQDSSITWRTHDYDTARQLISQHCCSGEGSAPGTPRSTRSSTTSTC